GGVGGHHQGLVGREPQVAELLQGEHGVRGQEQRTAGGRPRRAGIQRGQGHREQDGAVDDDRDPVLARALPQVGVHGGERGHLRGGQGGPDAQVAAARAPAQGGDPGQVAGQEAHQPGREGGVAAAEQGHIAGTAQGQGPLDRTVAARHQQRHQQRLGQPAPAVASGDGEQRVDRREGREHGGGATGREGRKHGGGATGREHGGGATGHTAPPESPSAYA